MNAGGKLGTARRSASHRIGCSPLAIFVWLRNSEVSLSPSSPWIG